MLATDTPSKKDRKSLPSTEGNSHGMTNADIARRFALVTWHKPGFVGVRREDADRLVQEGYLERRRLKTYEYRLTLRGYLLAEANIDKAVVLDA